MALINRADMGQDMHSPAANRRSDARYTTVFRPISIASDAFRNICIMRNISETGLMCSADFPLPEGTQVTMEISTSGPITGQVMWVKDQKMGVRFDEQIDVATVLHGTMSGRNAKKIARPPRLEILCDAHIMADDQSVPVRLCNISQRGARIEFPFLSVGDEVELSIEGLDTRKATVRWVHDGHAGLNFFRPIDLHELARWAKWLQVDVHAKNAATSETDRPQPPPAMLQA